MKGWLEPRATGFTNRWHLDRLLMLMQLQLNGLADVDAYTVRIREWLAANDGRPVTRRREVTDHGDPSLLSRPTLDAPEKAEETRLARRTERQRRRRL